MSAHLPEFRRAINGRTWDREWQPYAGTHYKRSAWGSSTILAAIVTVAGCVLIGAMLAQGV